MFTGYSKINGLPFGTIRELPSEEGFARAILVDQFEDEQCWLVVDLWGVTDMLTDIEVLDWPIVHHPANTTLAHQKPLYIQGTLF